MNPLDRIAQLTERAENAEELCDIALSNCESAQREVALLRSQLADARQQLERDSATIANLAKDKRELVSAVRLLLNNACAAAEDRGGKLVIPCTKKEWDSHVSACRMAELTLSRHA